MTNSTPTLEQAGAGTSRLGRIRPRRWGRLATGAVVTLGAIVMVLPIYYMVLVASHRTDLGISALWFDGFALPANISEVLSDERFPRYFLNSFIMAASIAFLDVVLSAMAGFALAKYRFPLRRPLFIGIIAILTISPIVVLVPTYILVTQLGWVNSYTGLIIPLAMSAFGVFLVRQFALGIPDAYLHAARIDGAPEWRVWLEVAVPMMRTALLTLFLLQFVVQWDNLIWPLVVGTSSEYWTIAVGLSSFQTEIGVSFRLTMAGSLLAAIPPMILFVFLQRYYVRGLTLGGIRG